jgi:hypothetical protein
MAKITIGPQEIPSALLNGYKKSLTEEMPSTAIRKRYPWRLPPMQNNNKGVSQLQRTNREIFKKCVRCFNRQPAEGGAEPPDVGPRNRAWWYEAAEESGLWYYDYFLQQTINKYLTEESPDWCYMTFGSWLTALSNWPTYNTWANNATPMGWRIEGSINDNRWQYIRLTDENSKELFMYITGSLGPWPGISVGYQQPLEIYNVPGDWNDQTITWNNKPALGDKICNTILTFPGYNKWTSIITEYAPRICIKQPTAGKWQIVVIINRNHPYTDKWAHYVP